MKPFTRWLNLAAMAGLAAVASAAFAHSDAGAKKAAAAAARKEQKEWGIASDAKAGKTGQIIWKFNRAGEFDFACLVAGHYQSGMMGKIKVLAVAAK